MFICRNRKTSHFNGMLKQQRVGAISLRPFSIGPASLSLFAQGDFLAHYIVVLTLNSSVRPLPSRKFSRTTKLHQSG